MSRSRHHTSLRGFTLVELIVSIGLLTIVIVIAMSAYLSLISLDRKARATNDVMTNLSFAVEAMSRSIRTGSSYDCGGYGGVANCVNGSSYFSFINENNQPVAFLLKSDGTIGTCVNSGVCTSGNATTITDPRIRITNMTFYTQGAGTGDGLQPRVIFTVSGSITPDPTSAPISFTIEGGATQRLIDL
ncbi:MAG TPA: type II secretion system protein [Candidatus Paceibacterota bacterium]|nr:type II secretion system protein [Candidatus Paceibacterota bacterium]